MRDLVFNFLTGVLGTDGARALRKATDRESGLEPLLVPRAALAWINQRHSYEGLIPGIPNSYLRFEKSSQGYTGSVSLQEGQYAFANADSFHVASAMSVGAGVEPQPRQPVRDQALVRLGKSIDALVKAQEIFKSDLRKSIFEKKTLEPSHGYKIREEHTSTGLKVHAHDANGNHVGTAWFTGHPQGIKPVVVGVDDSHQRRGLATAMYDHAKKVTGKNIVPADVETADGAAFHSHYKTELPGQQHKPTKQIEAQAPMPPQKQPPGAKPPKPKLPKLPALKVEKSEAARPCDACGGSFFKGDKFTGCVCFRDLSKSVRTVVYGDGYVLEFAGAVDRPAFLALQKALRGE